MLKELASKSLEDFTDVLASKSPVPGGGGAAALVGALGVALCSMVGNYTTGKKTYAAVEDDVQRMLAEAKSVRLRLLELVREDAEAFFPLSKAYAIPRDNPRRAKTLEEATKGACHAPLEMMRQICSAIELLEEMGQKGSRMLLSDVGCGALLCRAALEAASLNVLVNTKSLADRDFARAAEEEVDAMLAEYCPRAEECAQHVTSKIRNNT
jgi:formiminotetrahydrofolate cyclodeaminase